MTLFILPKTFQSNFKYNKYIGQNVKGKMNCRQFSEKKRKFLPIIFEYDFIQNFNRMEYCGTTKEFEFSIHKSESFIFLVEQRKYRYRYKYR